MGALLLGSTLLTALLVALLAVPIDLEFTIDRIRKIHGRVNVRWLFGLAQFSVDIPDTSKPDKIKKKRTKDKLPDAKQSRTHKKEPASTNFFNVLKQSTFRRRFFQFIKDLLRATHSHELMLRCRIGLGDPADTGQLWALLGPIAAMVTNVRSTVVRIEPEFIDTVFEIHSHGKFRLVPLEVIALTVAFALSPPSIRAWRTLSQNKA